jgi:hypothetical protein
MNINPKELRAVIREFFDADGQLQVRPYQFVKQFRPALLRAMMLAKGIYVLPTTELLLEVIHHTRGQHTVEICAGNGAMARTLGMPATDSYLHERPEIAEAIRRDGAEPAMIPRHVLRMDAADTVQRFMPACVVGLFVNQLGDDRYSSPFGVDEEEVVRETRRYIHVGNESVHRKRILRLPHRTIKADWIVTRAPRQRENCLWIWD